MLTITVSAVYVPLAGHRLLSSTSLSKGAANPTWRDVARPGLATVLG